MTEDNITDYETLVEKTKATTDRYHELSQQIKEIETRMAEITELKKHIINYSKTKDLYVAYRKSGFSKKFFNDYTKEILTHLDAKKAFDTNDPEKILSIKTLDLEYRECYLDKKKLYNVANKEKATMKEFLLVKANIDNILSNNIYVSTIKNTKVLAR